MFYAPIIFKTISPANGALLSTVIMGAINVAATFISVAALDKSGRKARAHSRLHCPGNGSFCSALPLTCAHN